MDKNKNLIKELTLVLMYLTSYEQNVDNDSVREVLGELLEPLPVDKVKLSYSMYQPEILEELNNEGLISHRLNSIKNIINNSGIEQAQNIIEKYKF